MGNKNQQKRRQKSAERHAAKRKEKKQAVRQIVPASPRVMLQRATTWPLYECLLAKGWKKQGEIVQAIVTRVSPTGEFGCGVFLIDLGCLGIKNAYAKVFRSEVEYQDQLREPASEMQQLQRVDLDLVAKIVREATAYAKKLGFAPHRDARQALPFLQGADPDACATPVPLGNSTGQPLYVAGPHDNVRRIVAQLERAVGADGFGYLGPPKGMGLLDDGDELELEEEEGR